MASKKEIPVQSYRVANVVDPELGKRLERYRTRLSVMNAGYPVLTDYPVEEGWGEFPAVPFQRATIYRGNAETWAYSHHQAIAKWGDRYVATWANGFLHEDYIGQEIHYASSEDGLHWSEPGAVVRTPVESGLIRSNAALYASGDRLYSYVGVAKPAGDDFKMYERHLDVYETRDLEHWTHHERVCDQVVLFEQPRMTHGGRLMCCGVNLREHHAMVLIWDDPAHPERSPRVVNIPPSPEVSRPEEGTWYQTADGRIWMYQRDGSMSCRLGLAWSDDEGNTWSELLRTDFPNTCSRAFAGRLPDGRYYITGNNYDMRLDRRHLLIALSDDGYIFDRQYTLVGSNITRRIDGRHKEDGCQYPNCLIAGDKLFVVYSVNKEDIEVGIADMTAVE